jgi:hypothetical protein
VEKLLSLEPAEIYKVIMSGKFIFVLRVFNSDQFLMKELPRVPIDYCIPTVSSCVLLTCEWCSISEVPFTVKIK